MPSGRKPRVVESQRREAVRQKITEGFDNAVDIARSLHNQPGFDDVQFTGTYNYILRLCKREGIVLSGLSKSTPSMDTAFPYKPKSDQTQPRRTSIQESLQVSPQAHSGNDAHPIEHFIQTFKINLPAGSYAEFTRFVLSLKKVTGVVEAEAALVPELRRQVIEMQEHIKEMEARTPDAKLQEENECLRSVNREQAEKILKWKMDHGFTCHRPLTVDHLAVPPKPV